MRLKRKRPGTRLGTSRSALPRAKRRAPSASLDAGCAPGGRRRGRTACPRHTLVTSPAQGTDTMTTMIHVENVAKPSPCTTRAASACLSSTTSISVAAGEALVLAGASGAGKSSLLRILYGNYRPSSGTIAITHAGRQIDIVSAVPRTVLDIRRRTLGFVSQFLRVIPRVSALDIVRDPLAGARRRAGRSQRARQGHAGHGSTCPNGSGISRRRPSPAASSSASTSPAPSSIPRRSC
jgi:ABC-type glutathione transport system ATPase component